MIGISVSLYDRFDELAILHDIVRENWTDEYYLSVCSNHPDAEARIADRGLDLDAFSQGTDIEYAPEMDGLREHVNRICRVYDTIKHAATPAIKHDDVDYVVHVHADAWPLSEADLKQLVAETEDRDARAAFKGKGLAHRGHRLVGHMMDQFFVLDAAYAESAGFFEHEPLELIPDRGIHTLFAVLLLGKVGWSNVYFYSDQSEQQYWDETPATGARPMMYLPDYSLLHLAREDFPGDLGRALQTYYLRGHGLSEGEFLQQYTTDYYRRPARLADDLEEAERRLNDRLWFFDVDDLGRNLRVAQEYLDKPLSERVVFLARGALRRGVDRCASVLPDPDWLLGRQIPQVDPVEDADPELSLADVYAEALHEGDFPDGGWCFE